MMFRSYSNKSKGLCNYSNGNLFTCKNGMLFLRVKISCLRAKVTWYFTGVYIINQNISCCTPTTPQTVVAQL